MRLFLFTLLLLPVGLAATAPAPASLTEISRALGNGDVSTLTSYLAPEVELSVLDQDDFFTKDEATAQLKKFFASHRATSFSQIHNGVSPTTKAEYCIGNLTAGGRTFRVVIYLGNTAAGLKIKKMSFDEE